MTKKKAGKKTYPRAKHPNPKTVVRSQRIELFAQAIVEGKSQSDAYRAAYPSSLKWGNAAVAVQACRTMDDPNVALRIQQLKDSQLERYGASIDRVIQELSRAAFLDIRRFYDENGQLLPVHKLPEDIAAALCELSIEQSPSGVIVKKIKAVDKLKAVELLGKWFKMWTDKHELGGIAGGKPIEAQITHVLSKDMSQEELGREYDSLARRG